MKQVLMCGVALLLAVGCAMAPKVRYYTLDMDSPAAAHPTVNLVVQRIQSGEALTRKDILIKKSPTEIEYYAAAQWAVAPDELVTQKLRAVFGPRQDERPTVLMNGDLLAFEQVDKPGGAEAHVRLAIMFQKLHQNASEAPVERVYDVRLPAETSHPAAVVKALSQCLDQIAAAIATDASQG